MTPESRANFFKFLLMMVLFVLIIVLGFSVVIFTAEWYMVTGSLFAWLLGFPLYFIFFVHHDVVDLLIIERNISATFTAAQLCVTYPYCRLRRAFTKLYLNIRYGWECHSQIYDGLDVSKSEIRLVDIYDGDDYDSLECGLQRVSIGDTRYKYQALSYAWGSANALSSITVNGLSLHITKSLEAALKELRLPNTRRRVWIDALCINQQNILERGQQVSLMKEIYRDAREVLIWQGPQTSTRSRGMDFLALASTADAPKDWFKRTLRDSIDIYKNQWSAVVALFAEEYWKRVWIIQEIASASSLKILCGSRTVSWDVAVAAQSALNEMVLRDLPHHRAAMSDIAGVWHWVRKLNFLRLRGFEGEVTKGENLSILYQSRRALVNGNRNPLVSLLQAHWTALATDPRDKIYALVGLATDCQTPQFQIDYSWSKWRVYLEAIQFLVDSRGDLNILACSISLMTSPWFLRARGFPRWIPFMYWPPTTSSIKMTGGDRYIYLGGTSLFTASSHKRARARIMKQPPLLSERIFKTPRVVLEAKGCCVDMIGSSWPSLDIKAESRKIKDKIWHRCPEWVPRKYKDSILGIRLYYNSFRHQSSRSTEDERNRDQVTEQFWRTLIYNRTDSGDEPPSSWALKFAVIINGAASVPDTFLPVASRTGETSNARAWPPKRRQAYNDRHKSRKSLYDKYGRKKRRYYLRYPRMQYSSCC